MSGNDKSHKSNDNNNNSKENQTNISKRNDNTKILILTNLSGVIIPPPNLFKA